MHTPFKVINFLIPKAEFFLHYKPLYVIFKVFILFKLIDPHLRHHLLLQYHFHPRLQDHHLLRHLLDFIFAELFNFFFHFENSIKILELKCGFITDY